MTDMPNTTPDDSAMFAPIPSWERNKKRRGFGRVSRAARPAETRSFAEAPIVAPAPKAARKTDPAIDRLNDVDPASSTFAAPPVYASRAASKSSSMAPVAIAAGLIAIGGIAAAGWYYTQPHGQTGVAELTPGGSTTTTTTDTSSAPAAPSQMAQNAPPPPVAKATTTTTRSSTVTSHNRAAPARSSAASDRAADASTTAPAAPPMPLPTPGVAPPAAAAPAAPLVLNIPAAAAPQTVTPQPAPQTTAPPPTEVPQA